MAKRGVPLSDEHRANIRAGVNKHNAIIAPQAKPLAEKLRGRLNVSRQQKHGPEVGYVPPKKTVDQLTVDLLNRELKISDLEAKVRGLLNDLNRANQKIEELIAYQNKKPVNPNSVHEDWGRDRHRYGAPKKALLLG